MKRKKYYSKRELHALDVNLYTERIKQFWPEFSQSFFEEYYNNECPLINAEHFLMGSCQMFAFVLHWLNPKYMVHEIKNNTGCHYFCMYKGNYIDVKGATDDFGEFTYELNGQFVANEINWYEFLPDDFGEYYEIEVAFALALIFGEPDRFLLNKSFFDMYSEAQKRSVFYDICKNIKEICIDPI